MSRLCTLEPSKGGVVSVDSQDDPIQAEVEQAGAMAMINEKIAIKQKKMAGGERSETPQEEGATVLPAGLPSDLQNSQ